MKASTVSAACPDPVRYPVTVGDRDHPVSGQPVVPGRARQPDHRGPGQFGPLDGDRADPAGRPGHDHRVTVGQADRPDSGVGRSPGSRTAPRPPPRARRAAWGSGCAASVRANSAWLARLSVNPMTSSPAATPSTSGPMPAITPARSLPSPEGKVAGYLACSRPSLILASPGLIPAALTLTSTWPGPGEGSGTSATSRTSGPPYRANRTAFIQLPFR